MSFELRLGQGACTSLLSSLLSREEACSPCSESSGNLLSPSVTIIVKNLIQEVKDLRVF